MKDTTRMSIAKQIGTRMQAARECRRFSQAKVAADLGIAPEGLTAYEQGEASVSVVELECLSRILVVSLDYFFEGCPACGNARGDSSG